MQQSSLHTKIGEPTLENDFHPSRDALRSKRHRFEQTAVRALRAVATH
jgi:hypothetical protein